MGYNTWFDGSLSFNKPVTKQLREYLDRFANTRRMPRDNEKIKEVYPNWRELCFFGELGNKGEYFAPISNCYGQDDDGTVLDLNGYKERVQPGLWCQWVIDDDGNLSWDGNEKFYEYEEWLRYMIKHFFEPLGYVLNGDITWEGDESDDFGTIHVVDNVVNMQYGIKIGSMSDLSTNDLITELESRGYTVSK